MRFDWPLALAALAVLPVMVALYVDRDRRRVASQAEFGNPDLVDYARSFGIPGFRPESADDLYPTLMRALEVDGPAVVDVPIDYSENVRLTERLGGLSGLM